jgi:serine/threonine protein kinase/tetratricopeptide (TPR) repeat protein
MVSSARARSFVGTTRFQIRRQLGTGGTGVVYEAFDRERNAPVALKTLVSVSPDALARFKNEFRSLQDLAHPNLVRLDELMEADGTWFFTMELVDGVDFLTHVRPAATDPAALERAAQREPRARTEISEPLDDGDDGGDGDDGEDDTVLSGEGRAGRRAASPPHPGVAGFDERRLREALRQLVVGVSALHAAHKVHRDIKPGNVLVTADGRVVILDFGLITDPGRLESRAVGTANYMAPEQAAAQAVGPAADWYAVGVTLFRALTGGLPFAGTTAEIMQQKVDVEAPAPSAVTSGIPPDLDALCRELLRREPAARPTGRAIIERLGAAGPALAPVLPPAAAFVGRGRELAELAAMLGDVAAGTGVSVLVHGESGVGKSALVRQFVTGLARAAAPPLLLVSRCYERESLPFKALDQAMDVLARWLLEQPRPTAEALLPPRAGLLADLVPSFAPVAALVAGEPRITDPIQARSYAFAALRELVARIAGERPVVLVIDDLQWADGDSLALLTTLMAPPAPPILLCATVRVAADAEPVLARLGEHLGGDVRRLRVVGLPPDDARELATRLVFAASATGSSSVRPADIAYEAGGHPMFIDALVRHRVMHPGASGPLRLDDALRARTAAVARGDRTVLAHVCIAGGPIGQEICAHAVGIPYDELAQSITTLRAANLVRTHGIRRGDAVEPYHDRVREAVIAPMDAAERKDIHARLARALEASGQADPERLAVHHAESGDLRRAARYAARAADRAAASLAFDRAASLYRRALELDPANQQRLHVRLAEVLGQLGRGRESAESYLTAADLEEPARALELRRRAAEQHLRSGHVNEALRTLEAVLATVGMELPASRPRALASFVYQRVRLKFRGLDFSARAESAVEPDLLRRIEVCASLYPLGLIDTLRGHPFQMRYLRFALDAGVPARIVRAIPPHLVFVSTLGEAGKADAARLEALARRLAGELREPYLDGVIETGTGASAFLFGRWSASRTACDRAEAALRERCTGAAWELDAAQLYGLRSLYFLGQIAEIRRRLPGALTEARDRGDLYLSTFLRTGLPIAMAHLAADDAATARRHARQAMEEWSYQEVGLTHVHQLWGEVLLDLHAGATADAERRMAETWPRLERAMYLRIQLTRLVTLQLRATIAVASAAAHTGGERARRLAAARSDAQRIRAEGTAWATPLAALIEAGAASLGGDAVAAARHLEDAEVGLDRAEMGLHAAAARLQRGRLIGADEGASLIAAARAWMEHQEIRRPERIADVLVPGFAS